MASRPDTHPDSRPPETPGDLERVDPAPDRAPPGVDEPGSGDDETDTPDSKMVGPPGP